MNSMPTDKILCGLFMLFFTQLGMAQSPVYTRDDTLRGCITPQRDWWDLTFYKLKVKVNPADKSIYGCNEIRYKVLNPGKFLQIDLQPPLQIERAEQDGQALGVKKQGRNAYFIELNKAQPKASLQSITIWYSGIPQAARNAPWDGGFSWKVDEQGLTFAATSCQGLGASIWWPCKDHMYDEPDSQAIFVTVPNNLTDISNGRLRQVVENDDGTHTFEWFVSNPINNYGVNVNIANYTHFSDTLHGENGLLTLDYYVLPKNLEKAKVQFQQAKLMLRALEYWFGPYPFYEDGYKLVEVPYLGMEHQSSVTYGNYYSNGYLGRDLSGTGWGLKWDYIIIHESAHEWFANNITYRDIADMWVHESFASYSEGIYTEYHFGKKAGAAYIRGCRASIQNKAPIIGSYGVNAQGSEDMYPKGSNMLHTIRQIIDDDVQWRSILRGLNHDFYHQTVYGSQVEDYITLHSGKKLDKVFDQYLRHTEIPVLEYQIKGHKLKYRWTNCIAGFDMPVKVTLSPGKFKFVYPATKWKSSRCVLPNKDDFQVEENFYVRANRV
jgi:aminopeptidase N